MPVRRPTRPDDSPSRLERRRERRRMQPQKEVPKEPEYVPSPQTKIDKDVPKIEKKKKVTR